MKFPLPVDYFECPPLSPLECEIFAHQATQNARDMVVQLEKATITNPTYQWKRVANEAEVEIFRGKDPFTSATATLHCATIDIAGTLDEVAHFFRNNTTEEFKEMAERTGHGMLDAANLYWINNTPKSKARIQWFLVKIPFDVVVKKRDFCVLESSVLYDADENRRRTWVHCVYSIEIQCCPEFPNVIRGVQYGSGFICRETDRHGYVNLVSVTHSDLRGSLPMAIRDMGAKEFCRSIRDIDLKLREDRLSGSPFLTGEQIISLSSRQRCYLCKRDFGHFRKKKNCFKCGEVVCTQCGPKWNVKVEGIALNIRACTKCSLLAKSSNGADTDSITTPSSISSTEVWRVADIDDSDDDDDESSFVSFVTDSSESYASTTTGGRATFDHSLP
ncbi:hypothetical protein AC1031_011760 [Aphanomyces cochlioides]|nr:hypothetical protein AC1031_011760 [Aphanomyces cochlioides]